MRHLSRSILQYMTLNIVILAVGVLLIGNPAYSADDSAPIDLGGWDWGAVTEEDMTPADDGRQQQEMPQLPPGKAEADYEADTLPVKPFLDSTPNFNIIPAKRTASMYPCSSCHAWRKINDSPRPLEKPHNNFELEHSLHGKGEFWCYTCHDLENPEGLKDLEGNHLTSQESYLLCSQCHSRQAKDWAFGAHGKRIGGWKGQRTSLDCAACHYQHAPALKAREPMSGPVVRVEMQRPAHWQSKSSDPHKEKSGHEQPIWERYAIDVTGPQDLPQ